MLTIFSTGGTFDKVYFDANSAFSIGDPQVEPLLQEANINIDYKIESLLQKDSLDIDDDDRHYIVDKVIHSTSKQILITHGTDGMVATAVAIAKNKKIEKTIVLVGSMQPARMRVSDAPFNLGFAIASVQLLPHGIYIAMNGQIFPYDKVKKNWAESRFELINENI